MICSRRWLMYAEPTAHRPEQLQSEPYDKSGVRLQLPGADRFGTVEPPQSGGGMKHIWARFLGRAGSTPSPEGV